jgi:hypothetical protein
MQPRVVAVLLLLTAAPVLAQNTVPPAAIGNRVNGNSYQPTPREVAPREKAAGVAPSSGQKRQNGQTLWNQDARLLKREGLGTKSVPGSGSGEQR